MSLNQVLDLLQLQLPAVTFEPGASFFWSPKHRTITYKDDAANNQPQDAWALLHEAAHAVLDHQKYQSDLDLLLLEVAAWHKAKDLAKDLGITIDEDHIQDCLDTYRDWLHQRATCPRCSTVSLQKSPQAYHCHNCAATWRVSASRFCRPYRLTS